MISRVYIIIVLRWQGLYDFHMRTIHKKPISDSPSRCIASCAGQGVRASAEDRKREFGGNSQPGGVAGFLWRAARHAGGISDHVERGFRLYVGILVPDIPGVRRDIQR